MPKPNLIPKFNLCKPMPNPRLNNLNKTNNKNWRAECSVKREGLTTIGCCIDHWGYQLRRWWEFGH